MCGPYGWVSEKVCPYDGCFFEEPSTYHGYLYGNFTSTRGRKMAIFLQNDPFLHIMGGFSANFAPMMGAFWGIPAPIMGTFLEILPKLGVRNGYFPSK